jgi:hypothetical protein
MEWIACKSWQGNRLASPDSSEVQPSDVQLYELAFIRAG